MRTRGRLLQVLDKAENGPIVTETDFDRRYIREAVAGLVRKYDLALPKGVLVPSDDALADRIFLAGLELARRLNMTVVGFARPPRLTVYAHPERVRSRGTPLGVAAC